MEALDNTELEKEVEEAFAIREGEEPLDEEKKMNGMNRLRFKLLTRMFYQSPEEKAKSKPRKLRNPAGTLASGGLSGSLADPNANTNPINAPHNATNLL